MPYLKGIRLFFMLLLLLAASGCAGRTVDVIQPDQFKTMADRMSDELIARNILDSSRAYTPGLWGSENVDYGAALFQRLSPEFLFEDTVTTLPGRSFAESTRHSDRVQRRDKGFTIQGLRQTVTVNMIAVTDWNGDGHKDWIVSCLMESPRGGKNRDYYVVIADPQDEGPLRGTVVAVYENFGLAGRLYMRESRAAAQSAPKDKSDAPPSVVEESVPGLRPITTPPPATPAKREGLQERTLD